MNAKDYEMLAKFSRVNLTEEQTTCLADWLGMHKTNFKRIEFLRAAGMTDSQIFDQLQARLF